MLAAAPGSHMGRYLYEVQLCPGQTNEKNTITVNHKALKDGWQHLLYSFSPTLTASKIRIALAWSFSLRQALRAASRIFGSGTRSYPINVFIPETYSRSFYHRAKTEMFAHKWPCLSKELFKPHKQSHVAKNKSQHFKHQILFPVGHILIRSNSNFKFFFLFK